MNNSTRPIGPMPSGAALAENLVRRRSARVRIGHRSVLASAWHPVARVVGLLAAVLFVGGCQAPSVAPAAPAIEISSAAKRDGRGYPYGRSDGPGPYLRLLRLPTASDPSYGTTPENPICTGPVRNLGHILFLQSLRGPADEPIEYERKGSCCGFLDSRVPQGGGLLDVYMLKVQGSDAMRELFVDMYRPCPMLIPAGLTQRKP